MEFKNPEFNQNNDFDNDWNNPKPEKPHDPNDLTDPRNDPNSYYYDPYLNNNSTPIQPKKTSHNSDAHNLHPKHQPPQPESDPDSKPAEPTVNPFKVSPEKLAEVVGSAHDIEEQQANEPLDKPVTGKDTPSGSGPDNRADLGLPTSGGTPLPKETKDKFQPKLKGQNLDDVEIISAPEHVKYVGAESFKLGKTIYTKDNNPASHILDHEVKHVVDVKTGRDRAPNKIRRWAKNDNWLAIQEAARQRRIAEAAERERRRIAAERAAELARKRKEALAAARKKRQADAIAARLKDPVKSKEKPKKEPYKKLDLTEYKAKLLRQQTEKKQLKLEQKLEQYHPGIKNIVHSPLLGNGALALLGNPLLATTLFNGTGVLYQGASNSKQNNPSEFFGGALNLGKNLMGGATKFANADVSPESSPRTEAPKLTPGQSIATWGQAKQPLIVQSPIERTFETADGATAYAQSLRQPAVVTKQGDRYVINPLTDNNPNFPKGHPNFRLTFTRQGLQDQNNPNIANLGNMTPGLSAIITTDGYQIRQKDIWRQLVSENPDGTTTPASAPFKSTRTEFHTSTLRENYRGQREAFGVGLSNIKDKEQFLRQYKLNLRDTAFSALNTSEQEARTKQKLFANGMPASEAPKIKTVSQKIETLEQQISTAKLEIRGIEEIVHNNPLAMPLVDKRYSPEALEQTRAKLAQLEQQHRVTLAQYPLLSRVNPAEFNKLSPQDQAKKLHEACGGVLTDIQTTRQNILKGKLNLWQLAPLVSTTTNGLDIQPEQMEWVAEKIKSDKTWDVASKVGMGVLSIGLAIGGTALGGPVGAAMAWGAFGIGVGGAISETEQYFTNQAAANTNLDPNKSVVPQDMKGHWGWVVASWVGAGLDLGAAVHATRLLKAGMEVDQVIKLLSTQKGLSAAELKAAYTTLDKSASDPKTLQKLLKSAMPEKLAGQADELLKSVKVKTPEEFKGLFGSESADAVTTFVKDKDGVIRAQVFFRQGGNPLSMREEAVHIVQLAEGGDAAKKAARLTEGNLGNWPKMSTEQRLDLYKAKIEVEIDAQKRLLQQFGEGDPRYIKGVKQNLENLQSRLAEVDLGVKNPKSVEDADWLDKTQAPRLFSKESKLRNVVEEDPSPFGRVFARYDAQGNETFAVRMEGKDGTEAAMAWIETGSVRQVPENLAEVQAAIGKNISRVHGMASDGVEKAIRENRFDSALYAKTLARRLGGKWEMKTIKVPHTGGPGEPEAKYTIEATRIGD